MACFIFVKQNCTFRLSLLHHSIATEMEWLSVKLILTHDEIPSFSGVCDIGNLYLNCTFWYDRQHIIARNDFADCIPSGHRQRVHWTEKCIFNRQNHNGNHMTANDALSNIIISFVKCTILYLFWYQMNFSLSIDRCRVLSLLKAKCYLFRAQLHWMR